MLNPLGKSIPYKDNYDSTLLFRIERSEARGKMGIGEPLPFSGRDIWICYELLWLGPDKLPYSASLQLSYPCNTQYIVESKSLKLYLGSFHNTVFPSQQVLQRTIQQDLELLLETAVQMEIFSWQGAEYPKIDESMLIDSEFTSQKIIQNNFPKPIFITAHSFTSHLLRSICPVTGQPDTGTIVVQTSKKSLDEVWLLDYITSLRNHQDFHEACCEKIFMAIKKQLKILGLNTTQVWVGCFYARRGGIAICPVREG